MPRKGERVKHYVDPQKIRENVDAQSEKYCEEERESLYCFASRLNDAMLEKDISQEELRKELDVSSGTISAYRNGSGCPSMMNIIRIAKLLDISTDYLLGLSKVKNTKENYKIACKTTGLTEMTIKRLRGLTHREGYSDIINEILGHKGFYLAIEQLNMYVNSKLDSDTSYMLRYADNGKPVLDEIGHMIKGGSINRIYYISARDYIARTVDVFIRKRVEGKYIFTANESEGGNNG